MKKLILSIISILIVGLFVLVNGVLSSFSIDSSNVHINLCTPGTWLGTTSTDWNLSSNWCDGIVPTSSIDVTILSVGNQPTISTSAECNNISISRGAKLTISGSKLLTVNGNWTNEGTFTSNSSTVTFNGSNQTVVNGIFHNLICKGSGTKTLTSVTVNGILSLEETASIKNTPIYGISASLRYNTSVDRTIGDEWASISNIQGGGIIIENTGIITLNANKLINYNCPLTIAEGATFNMGSHYAGNFNALNLTCGGQTHGSAILGTGLLKINGNVTVTNVGHGIAGATINCPITLIGFSTFTIANNGTTINSDDDLTVNGIHSSYDFTKSGKGTLNLGIQPIILLGLTITEGDIIIPIGGNVKIIGNTNIQTIAGLIIKSDETGTGSFITNKSSGVGTASVTVAMTSGAWHLVASPVAGQSFNQFLTSNITIPTDEYANRGMRNFNPSMNQWDEFFTNTTPGYITTGYGYCMRVRQSQSHKVIFTGTLNAETIVISGLTKGKWNCVGNPFTSAIAITTESSQTKQFINDNVNNLDPAYGAIYIWDQPDASNGLNGKYTIISNASGVFDAQLGQGFMVKMASEKTSLNFDRNMQHNLPNLSFKSTDGAWPAIKLIVSADSLHSSTLITFHEGMTKGLDPTYDAGMFPSPASLNLYTRLVEDYGLPFAIQALPSDAYENTVVPLGIDCTYGGAVSFSAEGKYLPAGCTPILEDRLMHTFTNLSANSYTTELTAEDSGAERFFLHTSYNTTGTDSQSKEPKLSACAIGNTEIRIQGTLYNGAVASVYDIQGRLIVTHALLEESSHRISLPSVISGIYLLQVLDQGQVHAFKLRIKE